MFGFERNVIETMETLAVRRFVKKTMGSFGVDYRALYQHIFAHSLRSAIREQGLWSLLEECRCIVPDISDQNSWSNETSEYRRYAEIKMRGMHVFQVRCALDAIELIGRPGLHIIDLGDSSGNHTKYLKHLTAQRQIERVISINLDPVAVEKIKSKGGEAILCRAEELDLRNLKADLFMSFEMVEHLMDPARFLYKLASANSAEYFLMTVPYCRRSRVGIRHLRLDSSLPEKLTADDVHMFELAPEDWNLLALFSGWRPLFTRTYWQYPRYSPLRVTRSLWRTLDYEGFWGVLWRRDLSIAKCYVDW